MNATKLLFYLLALSVVGCSTPSRVEPEQFTADEAEALKAYDRSPIALSGRVVDRAGLPIGAVLLRAGEDEATSGPDGAFSFDALPRKNVLLEATKQGYYPGHIAVWLARGLKEEAASLDPLVLQSRGDGRVRLLFAGDTAFGRRYLDPDEATPLTEVPGDHPGAVILPSAAAATTRDVLAGVRPYFQAADHATVNLESVVTDRPQTPHPTKAYVYFSLPPSLEALSWLGVDYVSLGNNHVYDYLAQGLADTLEHVEAAGLQHSGLGTSPDAAWAPYRLEVGTTPLSMVSACSIDGAEHEHRYVADDSQGGAANLRDRQRLEATISGERAAGRLPIAIWHTGDEYAVSPTSFGKSRMELAAEQGAALVVSHHAHVAMGFGRHAGVPIVFGLGNFAFDQDRLETMMGLLAQVDVQNGEVVDVQGIPTQLESYRVLPVSGPLADSLLRRITELSGEGVLPYPQNGRAEVFAAGRDVHREVGVELTIPGSGWTVLDLREYRQDGESLASAQGPVLARPGRPLMNHGTMEDYDVDDDRLDVAHWDVTGPSRFACLTGARRGAAGLCSIRSHDSATDTVIAFRNRIRVWGDSSDEPNKDLSLLGWIKGKNAGPLGVVVRYYASEGEQVFGEEIALEHPGGDFEWARFIVDLHMPNDVAPSAPTDNPRALRFFMRHGAPAEGHGLAMWDDFAVINWEQELDLAGGATLACPNVSDFLRITGAPGKVALELTFRRRTRLF